MALWTGGDKSGRLFPLPETLWMIAIFHQQAFALGPDSSTPAEQDSQLAKWGFGGVALTIR
jgi:hypothetical protein